MRTLSFCIFIFLLLTNCYEGMPEKTTNTADIHTLPSLPKTPEPKTFSYALVHLLKPSDQALTKGECGSHPAWAKARQVEFLERTTALSALLDEMADTTEFVMLDFSGAQCENMRKVEFEAAKNEPWVQNAPPSRTDTRAILHLKVVFWDDDLALTPHDSVMSSSWAVRSTLEKQDWTVQHKLYIAQSSTVSGYFQEWKTHLVQESKTQVLEGATILLDEGSAQTDNLETLRAETIAKETTTLRQWLVQ